MAITVKSIPLESGEYYTDKVKKDTIYIHHTAGSHRPDWTIAGWNKDRSTTGLRVRVATAYVIGSISTTDGNADWDGVIVNCFPDDMWAHHLGLTSSNNVVLNQKSIAIELCNYGQLTKLANGQFLNYVNKPVPLDQVAELATPFQGFKYYHKYSAKQLASLKNLLLDIANRHSIDLKSGLRSLIDGGQASPFGLNTKALQGMPGLWTHTSVRKDKFDCSPQLELIEMIKSL